MTCCPLNSTISGYHSANCDNHPFYNWKKSNMNYTEGYGKATFYRLDGETVVIDNVKVDDISSVAANKETVCAENEDGDIFHIPFVAYWKIDY